VADPTRRRPATPQVSAEISKIAAAGEKGSWLAGG